MKNIHILPTDKPSRLYKGNLGKPVTIQYASAQLKKLLNIYITSDEEIKDGEFATDGKNIVRWCKDYIGKTYKKIILTTDQNLIKDGVQSIPDDFLEWFVKNPSCEFVETVFNNRGITGVEKILKTFGEYKIIIPTEEPKQYLTGMMKDDEELGLYDYGWCKGNVILPKENPGEYDETQAKQETLEEAAERCLKENNVTCLDLLENVVTLDGVPFNQKERIINAFVNWQKQQQKQ